MNMMEIYTRVEIKEDISSMKEEILEPVKEGIDKLVDSRNKELEGRKIREMNLSFNLPEYENDVGSVNKQADESVFKNICSRLELEDVNTETSFRLGRKIRKSIRPLKVILSDKAHRKYKLDISRFIPQKLSAE